MAQVDRSRRGFPARAARRSALRPVRARGGVLGRVVLLAGLVAGGWLLGASAAGADTGALDEVVGSAATGAGHADAGSGTESAEPTGTPDGAAAGHAAEAAAGHGLYGGGSAGQSGDAADTAESGESTADRTAEALQSGGAPSVEEAVGTVGSTVGDGARGTGGAVERTGEAVHGVVGGAVKKTGTDEVVAGTAEVGRALTDGAEGGLARAVDDTGAAAALGETGQRLRSDLERTADAAGLPGQPGADRDTPESTAEQADSGDRTRERAGQDRDAGERTAAAEAATALTSGAGAHAGDLYSGGTSGDDAPAAPAPAPVGHSDSTGTPTSPVPAPAAGFLLQRADALRFLPLRVVPSGEPAPVVRDAADDPSYSPD